jgi:transcriptional regulator with XRE-family HTH domain
MVEGDVFMTINGKLIKQMRKNMGKLYTQEYVARELNVPIGTSRCWEQSKNTPDTPTFIKLADYFKITTDELMGRSGGSSANIQFIPHGAGIGLHNLCTELE